MKFFAFVFGLLLTFPVAATERIDPIDCDSTYRETEQELSALQQAYRTYIEASYEVVNGVLEVLRDTDHTSLEERIDQLEVDCVEQQRQFIKTDIEALRSSLDRLYISEEFARLLQEIEGIAAEPIEE